MQDVADHRLRPRSRTSVSASSSWKRRPRPPRLSQLRATYDTSLWLLLAITGLVLLIACANVANLMLARATAREREIAVRLAIGASRRRLIGQLLTESAAARRGRNRAGARRRRRAQPRAGRRHLERKPAGRPDARHRLADLRSSPPPLAALTCAIVGVVPAFRATRAAPVDAMKSGGRGSTDGRERYALQRLLVVGQIAVSLVLLVGAALFVRSFYNLITFDAGIRQQGIGVVFVNFERLHIAAPRLLPFTTELLAEIKRVPGVENAAFTTHVPLMGGGWAMGVKAGVADQSTPVTWVSPEYFATMDRRLLAGRLFDGRDTATSPPVAVVTEAFMRVFYPGQEVLGKTLMTYAEPGYPETHYEIVGVLADAQHGTLRGEAPPAVLVPAPQHPDPGQGAAYFVRAADAEAAIATVRQQLTRTYPDMRVNSFVLERRVQESLVRERLMAMLSGFFGVLAALLATIGLYGVMAYVMQRRRSEVGIRLALGAQPGQVVRMVMRDAGILVVCGVAAGVALSIAAGRSAETLLFGLSPTDVATYAAAIALLTAIALVASLVPALRASRVDPMLALRQD